jgi:DNA polymerase III delta subunit
MITILHGDDQVKSRNELKAIQESHKGVETTILDGKKLELTALREVIESGSMFAENKIIIIENFFSSRGKNEEMLNYLKNESSPHEIIFWEAKEVNRSILAKLPLAKVNLFKLPVIIFKLLDSLRPGNSKFMLSLLEQALKNSPPEIVLFMLVRQIRLLLLAKEKSFLGVKDCEKLAPWQRDRLTRQANLFSLDYLLNLYKKLEEIEYQKNTGQNSFVLKKTLELFILSMP